MKRISHLLVLSILCLVSAISAYAQTQPENSPTDQFGRIFSARLFPVRIQFAAGKPGPWAVTPSFRYSDTSWKAALGLTYSNVVPGTDRGYRLAANYGYIDADGSDHFNAISLNGALSLFSNDTFAGTAVAAYGNVINSYSSEALVVAVDQTLPRNFGLTYNLAWARVEPDKGGSVDDFQPGIGASYGFGKDLSWILAGDYTLKNDVDGEASWTASIEHEMTAGKINFGYEKHDVFTAKFTHRF